MSKERFEWLYNEKVLKHYMVDNLNNQQLGYEDIVNLLNQQNQRITELEEQPIENEEENLALAHTIAGWDDYNQEKIDFAIEQLEKVKKFVNRQLFITTKGCSDLDEAEAKGCNELREETIKEIDNQIKQLKEMK